MPAKKKSTKYNEDVIWKCYKFARHGHSDSKIATNIGVDKQTLFNWIKKYKVLNRAIQAGRKDHGPQSDESLESFVYKKLPPDAQDYFDILQDEVTNWNEELGEMTTEVKQMLYFNLWYENDFNESEALRKLGLSVKVVHEWRRDNPWFASIYNNMLVVRKDFVEQATMRLIKQGDPIVTMRVNAALNKDRGYGDKLEIEGNMQHTVTHGIDVTGLDLPADVMERILEAVRIKEAEAIDVNTDEETQPARQLPG